MQGGLREGDAREGRLRRGDSEGREIEGKGDEEREIEGKVNQYKRYHRIDNFLTHIVFLLFFSYPLL